MSEAFTGACQSFTECELERAKTNCVQGKQPTRGRKCKVAGLEKYILDEKCVKVRKIPVKRG